MPRRRSESDWQKLITEFDSGSLTMAAFCTERNLNPGYFSKVRSRLRKTGANDFVPIRVAAVKSAVSIQVNDIVIRCESGTPAAWLRDLINALRG